MTKTKLLLSASVMLCAAFSLSAQAKLYKWVDDKGVTHYSESLPPEYADTSRVQIDSKGRIIKKKEDHIENGGTVAEQKAAQEQHRKDNALLNTYSNEKEIDLARDRNLQQVEARINSIQVMQKAARDNLNDLNREAGDSRKAGKPITASLAADIKNAEDRITRLKKELDEANQKADSVRAAFDADKKRYRELTGGKGE